MVEGKLRLGFGKLDKSKAGQGLVSRILGAARQELALETRLLALSHPASHQWGERSGSSHRFILRERSIIGTGRRASTRKSAFLGSNQARKERGS